MPSESPYAGGSTPRTTSDGHGATPTNDAKRKAEPTNGGTQTRAKRNRYISIACNECKRRKIKCNGQVPCQRCGHLNLECLYAPNCCNGNFRDSEEFRSMRDQISLLQEQVNDLFVNLNNLRSSAPSTHVSPFDSLPNDARRATSFSDSQIIRQTLNQVSAGRQARFQGPTSSEFNLDVARSSLKHMGITPTEDSAQDNLAVPHLDSSNLPHSQVTFAAPLSVHPSKDPLWTIEREEVIRLCNVYDDEVGTLYSTFDMKKIMDQANLLYNFLEAATRTGLAKRSVPGADCLEDDQTIELKMILAISLLIEGDGHSELATRLFNSVKPSIHEKMWGPPSIHTTLLITMAAAFYFHSQDDVMAYRIFSMAVRMCLEMGLHRRDALFKWFPDETQRNRAVVVFWSIYALDRRWSLSAGLPFILQDEDIDPKLPEPESPYLRAMIPYNQISSKIWHSGFGYEGLTDAKRDKIDFLDYQVLQWYKHLPENLKLYTNDSPSNEEANSRALQRWRFLLYLRMNQLRIFIYRPVLHTPASIVENHAHAQTVIDIAKDSIRVITQLDQTSDVYRSQQVCWNFFLVAAITVLFLAVCHAPAEFGSQVRDEFYMAVDLVNGFSMKSHISQRLWRTIKDLRRAAEKLGLFNRMNSYGHRTPDPHSSAAVAMAGLAGHSIEDMSAYGPLDGPNDLGSSPMNGMQMRNELTNLFEAVGGYGSNGSLNGYSHANGDLNHPEDGFIVGLGTDIEWSHVFQGLT